MKKIGIVYINNKTEERKVQFYEVQDEIADEIYLEMAGIQDDEIQPDTPLADILLATKYVARLNEWYDLPSFQILAPDDVAIYFEKIQSNRS